MFQFPGFAFLNLYIQSRNTCFTSLLRATEVATITKYQVGCPIQKSMDQSLFSAPHGLSQSITSFIASYCQGIHQTPFSRLIWSRNSQTISKPKVVVIWDCFSPLPHLRKATFHWTQLSLLGAVTHIPANEPTYVDPFMNSRSYSLFLVSVFDLERL